MIFLELKDKYGIQFILNLYEVETFARLPHSGGSVIRLKSGRDIEIIDELPTIRKMLDDILNKQASHEV